MAKTKQLVGAALAAAALSLFGVGCANNGDNDGGAAAGEHPRDSEHPSEHPSGGEHPEGSEHPSEHPQGSEHPGR